MQTLQPRAMLDLEKCSLHSRRIKHARETIDGRLWRVLSSSSVKDIAPYRANKALSRAPMKHRISDVKYIVFTGCVCNRKLRLVNSISGIGYETTGLGTSWSPFSVLPIMKKIQVNLLHKFHDRIKIRNINLYKVTIEMKQFYSSIV